MEECLPGRQEDVDDSFTPTRRRARRGHALGHATGAVAADSTKSAHASTSSGHPKGRTGDYKIMSEKGTSIRAKCAEGGNVFVSVPPAQPSSSAQAAARDHALRSACKAIDLSK